MWASNEPMKDPADFQTWKSKGNAIQHNTCLSANGKKSSVVSWGGPGEGENEGSAQFILRSLFFHSSLLKKKKSGSLEKEKMRAVPNLFWGPCSLLKKKKSLFSLTWAKIVGKVEVG